MLHTSRAAFGGPLTAALVIGFTAQAAAHDQSGGAIATPRPVVSSVTCGSGARASCTNGDFLRVRGEGLESTSKVAFLGAAGRGDDRHARPRSRGTHLITVRVPRGARSGPVRLSSSSAGSPSITLTIEVTTARPMSTSPQTPGAPSAFPVSGDHSYGSATNRFGGGRGHQGQDVFADCGTPVVAALAGTVTRTAFEDRAGNYAVITAQDGSSHVYMHMRTPATVVEGQSVIAGQSIGAVGDSGRASGCHLHFEIWATPGWYTGGSPIDPLPQLQDWESRLRH